MVIDLNKLSHMHIDALREIGNIGAGNAATSMAALVNKRIQMDVPSVNIVTFDEMMDIVGGSEQLIVALFFKIYGDTPGTVYFMLSIEEAERLISYITDDVSLNLRDGESDKLALSALEEVGNIITGSYISALSDFMNVYMYSSVPHLSIDMAGAILTVGLIEVSQVTDYAIVINTEMNESSCLNGVHGHFFLLPNPESFTKMFTALGIHSHE